MIRSKVEAPPVRDQTLARSRLLGWLSDHRSDRLKLIVAEAGYGKTTLLADFARRDATRCLWYKLESSDRDWVTFINYLIAAGRQAVPGFAPSTASLLRDMATTNPSRDVVLGSLISELSGLGDEPTMLILDDFQLVQDSDDVKVILGRFFECAPPKLSVLISSRRRPELQIGRLTAQGEVAELTTDDLRFSSAETHDLFASTYQLPLEADLLHEVDTRTEGWGASLQLLYSSIRTRHPAEVRSFIREMSGAEGSLYDFLAEEVVGRLTPELQRFLTRTALLETIVPPYAAAVVGTMEEPVEIGDVVESLMEAEDLGLLSRTSVSSVSLRSHPLLRDFLGRSLRERTTAQELREMHRRVARVAEPTDWLTASHHFIEAGDHADAMRTLADAAEQALGGGAWGAATQMLPRIRGVEVPAAVIVLEARTLASNDPRQALAKLETIDADTQSPLTRALIRQIQTYACHRAGDFEGLLSRLDALLDDPSTPDAMRRIAAAHRAMFAEDQDGSIATAGRLIEAMAISQAHEGHHYYAGISYHNAAVCALVQGKYVDCIRLGESALAQLESTGVTRSEAQSTHTTLYLALSELGRHDRAKQELASATDPLGEGDADAFAEAATTLAVIGNLAEAETVLEEGRRRAVQGRTDLTANMTIVWAEMLCDIVTGRPLAAYSTAINSNRQSAGVGYAAARLTHLSLAALLANQPDASRFATEGLTIARKQGARRFEERLRIILAVAQDDTRSLGRAIASGARLGALTLLETADAIARGLHLLDPLPPPLLESVRLYPERWLPVLRRTVSSPHSASAFAAAKLLSRVGTMTDVPRLVAFDRAHRKRLKGVRLARELLSVVSPQLVIRDLGRVMYEVDGRVVPLTETRRKAAALLMYLISRPQLTATREQVIDDLWPDADPEAGANSLNQTLYFLRRDIDPWYDDAGSPNYVTYESEILWLDRHLVVADSTRFAAAAAAAQGVPDDVDAAMTVLSAYGGRFAPEFEYEEWALAWRDQLHASFLALAQSCIERLAATGRMHDALHQCQRTLELDPSAIDFERLLIGLYGQMGLLAAVRRQYAHYARSHRVEIGVDAPSLATVLAEGVGVRAGP